MGGHSGLNADRPLESGTASQMSLASPSAAADDRVGEEKLNSCESLVLPRTPEGACLSAADSRNATLNQLFRAYSL